MSQHPADRPAQPNPTSPHDRTRTPERSSPRSLPLYKVVLHHHATADLMFIVRTVMELTHFCKTEATHKMWQAHHGGRSVLLVTYKERAEMYVEQFASRNLTVTIEPA